MKSNPGGEIGPDQVVGRDLLIDEVWQALDRQSVLLTAERRIGKTSIIKKMAAEPRPDWTPVFRDLERCHSAADFAVVVFEDVQRFLARWQRLANSARRFLDSVGGVEIGGVLRLPDAGRAHWKTLLEKAVVDLQEAHVRQRCVFFWDEFPYMLDNICKQPGEGEAAAMQILDVLRSLRQQPGSRLRMVLTGSIGLHHVVGALRKKGYANSPVNDMQRVEVGALASADAISLARQLIEGEQLKSTDAYAAAAVIADAGDGVPFYIHHLVRTLKTRGLPCEAQRIGEVVGAQLLDTADPWELGHYRDRLRTYYPELEPVATAVLDALAIDDAPLSLDDVLRAVKIRCDFQDRERLLELLKAMARDHYLERAREGHEPAWRWRYQLIRRWWILDREL